MCEDLVIYLCVYIYIMRKLCEYKVVVAVIGGWKSVMTVSGMGAAGWKLGRLVLLMMAMVMARATVMTMTMIR